MALIYSTLMYQNHDSDEFINFVYVYLKYFIKRDTVQLFLPLK